MDRNGQCDLGTSVEVTPQAARESVSTIEGSLLRAVVRGELPLEHFNGQSEERPLAVCAADLAEGILNLKNDPAALTEWAGFILTASEFFKLEDELSEFWDRLLCCIWDLSFGGRLSIPAVTLAAAVRNRRRWA